MKLAPKPSEKNKEGVLGGGDGHSHALYCGPAYRPTTESISEIIYSLSSHALFESSEKKNEKMISISHLLFYLLQRELVQFARRLKVCYLVCGNDEFARRLKVCYLVCGNDEPHN